MWSAVYGGGRSRVGWAPVQVQACLVGVVGSVGVVLILAGNNGL